MSWGSPEWLDLLWAVPVMAALLVLALRRRAQLLARLGALASERVSQRALSIHRWRALFWLLGMVLGLLALAQPRWGYRWQELKREGLDIVVVLDVSMSMDAEDISPSRMERARREVLDLTELLAGDRVGLVVFAGGAYPRMPLTLDYGVLQHQVRDSDSGTLVAQGSDIGAAIDMAAQLLGPRGTADQVILLISDGEDHVGKALESAEKAAEEGIHIYTMGVGTVEGAPVPLEGGGFKKSRSGDVVISRLDEDALKAIAQVGRGAYVQSSASNRDIAAIYLEEIRGQLQGAEQGVRRERIWDERFAWPLTASILFFLMGSLLRPGPLRLPGAVVALFFVGALGTTARADDPSPPVSEADRLAAEQAARPNDLDVAEELGLALLQEGRADEAHDVLSSVAERTLDPTQRQRARYNAGHAAYESGHLTRAVEDWRRVLQENPEHGAAQTNTQILEQEIARRMQQQPPQQDQNQDGQPQDGQPQDGQPQDGQPQDGQQDGQPQDGQQDGQPQDGQQQDGQQDGQPQDGQPQDGQQDGQPSSPEDLDGTRDGPGAEQGDTGMGENMDNLAADKQGDGTPSDDDPKNASSASTASGQMTEEEAARTVDSVEEGRPQVVARPGAAGDKDW